MTDALASDLLRRNDFHVAALPGGYFDDVLDRQQPAVVSVCCADSRVSQEGMFDISGPGELFTPSNIGNQVRDRVVVDGDSREMVDVPPETSVYGFVYDGHGRYGGSRGRLYLVNADGRRDVTYLRGRVDDDVTDHVRRLTEY